MKLIALNVQNILSIGEISLKFGESGLVLVDGWNTDDETANGAGKTAIFNSIAFALYGKMPRDITSTDYLRKGAKTGYAEVEFEAGGSLWKIKRGRPTSLVVHKNGVELACTAEEVEGICDLTYQQFLMTMYAAQMKNEKFILLNDAAKKDFILQLLNLSQFNEAKTRASARLKELDAGKNKLITAITVAEQKIEILSEAVRDLPNLSDRLSHCDTLRWNKEVVQLGSVSKPDLSRYQKVEIGIQEKRKQFASLKTDLELLRQQRNTLLRTKKPINEQLDQEECPYCSETIVVVGSAWEKSSDVLAILEAKKKYNDQIDAQALVIKEQMDTLDAELSKESELDTLARKMREQQGKDTEEYRAAQARINELNLLISKKETEAQYLQESITKIEADAAKIDALKTQLLAANEKMEQLRKEIQLTESAQQVLSPAGVQAYVVDTLIDKLNERITYYVSLMWPNATYTIRTFKENKSGEVRSKFSEHITLQGKERTLGSLSGGERCCISLAVDLAIVDIVASFSGALMNPLILDEPLDGMDNANRERAIDLLYRLSQDKQIWIVDHSSEARALFSNVVKVVKIAGITSLA